MRELVDSLDLTGQLVQVLLLKGIDEEVFLVDGAEIVLDDLNRLTLHLLIEALELSQPQSGRLFTRALVDQQGFVLQVLAVNEL